MRAPLVLMGKPGNEARQMVHLLNESVPLYVVFPALFLAVRDATKMWFCSSLGSLRKTASLFVLGYPKIHSSSLCPDNMHSSIVQKDFA